MTSLLSYLTAAFLVTSLATLVFLRDPLLSLAILASAMATLTAVQEYRPRNHFVVTARSAR